MAQPRLASVLWPLLAELVLGFCLGLVGLWYAAQLGDASAAGFSLANQVIGGAALLFRVVNLGASVVMTQLLGAGNGMQASALARACLGASSRIGLVVAGLLWLMAPWLLIGLGASAEVQAASTSLLQWLALGLLADGWCACLTATLRAQLRGRSAMGLSLAMHGSHLLLCMWLMPRFGAGGFGMAMLGSRMAAASVGAWLWRKELGIALSAQDAWTWRSDLLKPALRLGLPGAAETIAYRLGTLAVAAAVATQGTLALAAHGYALQLITWVVLSTVALGFSCEIVVGHLVGAGQLRAAHQLVMRVLVVGLISSIVLALINVLAAPHTLGWFGASKATAALALPLLWAAVALEPGRTCNLVFINALRAVGDARYPVATGAVSMALVMALGAWVLGVGLGLGLLGVWIALAADELVRGVLMWRRWASGKWAMHARALRRAAQPTPAPSGATEAT